VINVFSGEIQECDVAVCEGVIVGLGPEYYGEEEIEVQGKWLVPGLMDGHLHIESTMLLPSQLAAALLPHGTTTIVSDPHEIANVMGLQGVRFMLEQSKSIPFDIFFMAPSCVPATHLETAGASLSAQDLLALRDQPRILGLAEMMNFPGLLMGDEEVLKKILCFRHKVLDGHSPLLGGYDLQAYLTAGIGSDHETTQFSEGLEKVASGMMVMIREGSSAKNMEALLPLVNPKNAHRFCLVTDDLHAEDIDKRGHLDFLLRKAMDMGMDPVTAVRLATLNPAHYFGLRDRGGLAPGLRADIVVLDDLKDFEVNRVFKDGKQVVDGGGLIEWGQGAHRIPPFARNTMNMASVSPDSIRIPHPGSKARVIEMVPGQIITHARHEEVPARDGVVVPDVERDILKLCVVERHHASGQVGLGLVRGFGLQEGAVASSVAHDSHNVIAAGVNDAEILRAIEGVKTMGGGLVVAGGEGILAQVPLDVAGLMSTRSLSALISRLGGVKRAVSRLGCPLADPFMMLSFLALPVIPELKLTDRGLVDVNQFAFVPLFLEQRG